ncbi:ECF transporter S component [Lacticaseibacillus paracasei]|uniref:ECF transporter S component n=1 Tax=Lacticaseibacillus paracasei TaxID=1597 RepID=UPI001F4ED269|nr:ECF transporter S component [Lacticaseibacillus paracasei]MCT3360328.1 ECF transporter S component [Lacticaseibacillus paracasei]MDP0528546.1 ECF transporter S component [Lacticaseibacillus paracasei]UNG77561.1 ECF transporter S component [Lacticaseibacillus paracasei]WBS99877.1 ECF transporter S component [Lacticaseibacillus paracasei]
MASSSKVHRLVGIALLAAIGYVLMMFSFPIIPAFPFLKLDLSDLVVLLGGLLYGPAGGIGVAFIRSLVHFALTGGGVVNLIGDLAAFIASVGFLLPVVYTIRGKHSLLRQIEGLVLGTASLTLVMSVLNWLVITPMYMAVFNFNLGMSLTRYVLIGVVPFNLIKGIVVSVAFFAIAKALAPWLARREIQPGH